MTISEADEIFKVWQQWFWPFHSLLDSIFRLAGIPESFLPYPKETIDEALEIMLYHYKDTMEPEILKAIEVTKSYLGMYDNDKDALDTLIKYLSGPGMIETTSNNIKQFTTEWLNWQKKQKT